MRTIRTDDGVAASGDVNHHRQLVWNAELSDETRQGLAQVGDSSLETVTFAVCPDARAQLSVGTPDTIFVLLNGVGDMHGLCYRS
jgi:hypothetical protein